MTYQLYRLFADLLEYPTPDLPGQARACVALLGADHPQAAALLDEFCAFADQTPTGQMEELYTRTFDMQPVCYPYIGYQLFGESYKRGAFLAKLKEQYQVHGFDSGRDLPDHLPVILRFLGVLPEVDQELIDEGVVPALGAMVAAFANKPDPYSGVIQALLLVLGGGPFDVALPSAQGMGMGENEDVS